MEAAAHPDWSGLPGDLMAMVMHVLDIPDLFRAGAVCTSWYAAYSTVRHVRIPIKDSSPCLFYSCAGDDVDTATLYSPSAGAAFKVRLPGPSFRSQYVVGSGHGWIVAADEESNLHLLNPLTTAQVGLPPVTGLHHVESFSDDQGRPMYNLYGEDFWHPDSPMAYKPKEMRLFLYERAYLSCSPSKGAACIVLLLHRPDGDISFARLGDDRWTHVAKSESVQWSSGYRSAAYNENDGLFYLVSFNSSIFTLDLNNGLPVMKNVLKGDSRSDDPIRSIILTPWGEIFQVWRFISVRWLDTPVQVPADCSDEVINPSRESYTDEIELYKVDITGQKLKKINSSELRGHAIFIGFNSPVLVSTEDFPMFKPNCAYITDDSSETICINMYGGREVGIWNFETEALESLDNLQVAHPWLNWPPPVWITPVLY
ncbi:hypothetical protein EJB05_54770, partial [Eragrostis curvula]